MGICLCLRRASAAQLAQLVSHPDVVFDLLGYEPSRPAPGLYSRLFGKKPDPVPPPVDPRVEDDETDLDKAWQAIHFLLTGSTGSSDDPLSFVGHDWPRIGTASRHEVGLGQAMMISPEALARFDDALAAVDDGALRARYDPDSMVKAKVYLARALRRDGGDRWDYVAFQIGELRRFAGAAAAAGCGAVVWMS